MGLPIFLLIRFGGECEIRTHGPVTADGFQDRCIKPLYQLPKTWVHLKLGAGHRIRTYVPFLGLITSQVHLTTLPTRLYHLHNLHHSEGRKLAGEVGLEPTIHTAPRKVLCAMYTCTVCNKSFNNHKQLAGHKRSHVKSHIPMCCCLITKRQLPASKLFAFQANIRPCVVCSTLFHYVPSSNKTKTCSISCARSVGNKTRGAHSELTKNAIRAGIIKHLSNRTANHSNRVKKVKPEVVGPFCKIFQCTCAHCGASFYTRSRVKYCSYHSHLYQRGNRNKYAFTFNVFDYPQLFDLELLRSIGWYSPGGKSGPWNPLGLSRDHKVSVNYAIKHDCDPYYIKHPMNCALIPHHENNVKKSRCSITYAELMRLVDDFDPD